MNRLLLVAAVAEMATGLLLIIAPLIAAKVLIGEEISEVAVNLGRICGFALFSFGLACWPGRSAGGNLTMAFPAMLIYSLLCTLYFLYLGISGKWVGFLLWPVIAWHGVVTIFFALAGLKARKTNSNEQHN